MHWGDEFQPPGNLPPNSVTHIAPLELPVPLKNRIRLARVTHALNPYGQRKNAAKKNGLTGEPARRILPQPA
jgi:hypothetical protein